jgi:hypothetical protein
MLACPCFNTVLSTTDLTKYIEANVVASAQGSYLGIPTRERAKSPFLLFERLPHLVEYFILRSEHSTYLWCATATLSVSGEVASLKSLGSQNGYP